MTALWTSDAASEAVKGRSTRAWQAVGVSIDSRTIAAGELFVALGGPSFDGHDFVARAFERGAAAALVSRVPSGLPEHAPLLMVDDTLAALTRLGAAGRARCKGRFIAVTGSVGKTGSKEALRAALGGQGRTYASAASFNNQWGVPLSLARMPADTEFGIFEIGMNHAGEITPLTRLAKPDVAIVTTIAPVHLGHFNSVDEIADAKAEIFLGVTAGGTAILNRDNAYFDRLSAAARAAGIRRIVGFGEAEGAEARLVDCRLGETSSEVDATVLGQDLHYTIGVPGRHWVLNSLAVIAAAAAAGADPIRSAAALAAMPGLPGRGQRREIQVQGGTATLIDESYNASPIAVRAAFAVLGGIAPGPGGRRIVVLGDMRELGPTAPGLHAELAAPLLAAGIDLAFTIGTDMAHLRDALPAEKRGAHAATASEMAEIVASALRPGDVVTVKGSLSVGMAAVVKRLTGDPASAGKAG